MQHTELKDIGMLLFRGPTAVRVVNWITLFRIVAFPLLMVLIMLRAWPFFKWLLLVSFFTDAIDGYLARRYHATSILGSKLDSIGDDLTVLAAVTGLVVARTDFVLEQWFPVAVLVGLYLVQTGMALYRYGKISTFHTYLAKTAAVVAAMFLLSGFFLEDIIYPLFYAAVIVTAIELVEEIILVAILKDYRSNVRGLYWVLRKDKRDRDGARDVSRPLENQ